MKVNDILVSEWGYDQTNVDFYKVVGLTPKSVKIVQVGNKIAKASELGMSEYVVPNLNEICSRVMTKRVKTFRIDEKQFVSINSFASAYMWDGKPVFQSHWH